MALGSSSPNQELEGIAIDGKTLRSSQKQGAAEAHLLSALSQRLTVVLGQVAVTDKTNETGVLDQLLARIGVAGRVTTTDALHTQREVAQAILDKQGDYLQASKTTSRNSLKILLRCFKKRRS